MLGRLIVAAAGRAFSPVTQRNNPSSAVLMSREQIEYARPVNSQFIEGSVSQNSHFGALSDPGECGNLQCSVNRLWRVSPNVHDRRAHLFT